MMSTLVDMEKPTYNKLTLHFFMFCRIETTFEFQHIFYPKECDLMELKKLNSSLTPEWIKNKEEFSKIYNNLLVIDILQNENEELKKYFSDYIFESNGIQLSEYFEQSSLRQYILYDIKLKSFMHSIEFELNLPLETVSGNDVSFLLSNNGKKEDLYNCVRNGIVKIKDNDNSLFLENSLCQAFKTITQMIKVGYNLEIQQDQFYVPTHSGNITVEIIQHGKAELQENVADAFVRLNQLAERIEYFDSKIKLNQCVCSFNGRFHSIITCNANQKFHFIPITFQAQLVWSYLETMAGVIENINIQLQDKTRLKSGIGNMHLISAIIEKIQILSYDNEVFKRSIENEADMVYKKFEESWHLMESLKAEEKYVNNLTDYLNRVHMEAENEKSERQNKILFVISLLQLLAVISIWGDFLSLEDTYGILLFDIFGYDLSAVAGIINSLMPILLIIISFVLLIKVFYKKKS